MVSECRWQTLKVSGTPVHLAYHKGSGCAAIVSIVSNTKSDIHILMTSLHCVCQESWCNCCVCGRWKWAAFISGKKLVMSTQGRTLAALGLCHQNLQSDQWAIIRRVCGSFLYVLFNKVTLFEIFLLISSIYISLYILFLLTVWWHQGGNSAHLLLVHEVSMSQAHSYLASLILGYSSSLSSFHFLLWQKL